MRGGTHRKIVATLLALAAFGTAGVIAVLRLVEESPSIFVVIPAICFPVAAALWLIALFRLHEESGASE